MPALVIVGSQWGDEGKGKIVDFLGDRADIVSRFQGGNNAGHTIVHDGERYQLHIMPSGVIRGKTVVVGNGCVVDLEVLTREIEGMRARGIEPDLHISDRAHIILPFHRTIDGVLDSTSANPIDTTKRGIGPAYSDKALRIGIRTIDLYSDDLELKVERCRRVKEAMLMGLGVQTDLARTSDVVPILRRISREILPYVKDTGAMLDSALKEDRFVLFEGAQGVLLDIDHGTYPYVTSSAIGTAGAATGSGISPGWLDRSVGIMKAYTTRVGEGPFPTELQDNVGEMLRQQGDEFGTTTGRPRRCGWLDLVAVAHTNRIAGFTSLAVTKIDVLTGIDLIKVATAYRVNDEEYTDFPSDAALLAEVEPVYEELPGWNALDADAVRAMGKESLPPEMLQYIFFIEQRLDVPVDIVSFGPARKDTLVLRDPWGY